ncbi:hypothetical protein ACH4TV_31320 [Streptomyces sp. NPDC020898]|uniref:hypothetical protein n=1 Tax=Streptomyces sp. NPDC020898 TaxID=3365101 RepID=UPI0037A5B7DE
MVAAGLSLTDGWFVGVTLCLESDAESPSQFLGDLPGVHAGAAAVRFGHLVGNFPDGDLGEILTVSGIGELFRCEDA